MERVPRLLLALLCGAVTMAPQPIDAPLLKPFADNRDWVLFHDLDYHVGQTDTTITDPKGFVTDFASIPQAFWATGLSPNGRYSKAAIVHDYLYWMQGCTRKQADNILMIAMKESEVDVPTRTAIYEGVRFGGDSAWDGNASERARGLPRIIPDGDLEFGPTVLWRDYRQMLARRGIADPAPASPPAYCTVGDTTDVPGRP
jgi:hypothetical protein